MDKIKDMVGRQCDVNVNVNLYEDKNIRGEEEMKTQSGKQGGRWGRCRNKKR